MSTGTQIQVVMPQMGVSVSEGTITKWLKQVGEPIARDEPLLEISTDKVDTEVPSPGEGVVVEIMVPEGETVDVGTVLAVIAPAGTITEPDPQPAPSTPEPTPQTPQPAPSTPEPAPQPSPTPAPAPPTPAPAPVPAPPPDQPPSPSAASSGNGKSFVSPVVGRIAAEHGVDATSVPGTGAGGRVTKKDILAFIESGQHRKPSHSKPSHNKPSHSRCRLPRRLRPRPPCPAKWRRPSLSPSRRRPSPLRSPSPRPSLNRPPQRLSRRFRSRHPSLGSRHNRRRRARSRPRSPSLQRAKRSSR